MSLIKLFKAPIKLFKKDVITFLIIKRHDLGIIDNKLRYVAVKPSASISQLRQKLWHLLDLPDYCEEIIVLKDEGKRELPMTVLRKGNDPQHPYILEVWLPGKSSGMISSTTIHNMITMGETRSTISNITSALTEDTENHNCNGKQADITSNTTINNATIPLGNFISDYKKSDLSCKISTSSVFFRLHGKKSRDNFANLLLKIQSDLTTLSTKLSNLENRIQL